MALHHSPRIVTDGLVLALDAADRNSYPGSGTTWYDLSGNGNNGTLVNGPVYDSGNNGSIEFDGVNDHIDCGNVSSLKFDQNDFTFGIFINFLNAALINQPFIQKRTSVVLGYEIHLNSNSKLNATAAFNFGGESNTTVQLNKWYYITVLRKNNVTSLYVDGIFDRSSSNTIDASSDNEFVLAHDDLNTRYLNCSIASIGVYNRALTLQEILQNYNATKTRFGL